MPEFWPFALCISWVAALGACVGSFVGVVVDRLPHGQSIVTPRSRCAACQAALPLWDNIPILSFLILRGRCRRCGVYIGVRHLVLEVLAAMMFVALFLRLGPSLECLAWLPMASGLLALTYLDIDCWWVPDSITLPMAMWAIAASFFPGRLGPTQALMGLLPALLLWATAWTFMRLTQREGLGLGDIKLLAVLGMMLGPMGGMSVLMVSALQGAVIGLVIVALGGHKSRHEREGTKVPWALAHDDWQPERTAVPFGPFLALAALEVVLAPEFFNTLQPRLAQLMTRLLA